MSARVKDMDINEIRLAMEKILASPIFANSDRLGRFLRYAVEGALNGNAEGLKEYVIGTEVYERRPPYDPRIDSIVRTEASRLRAKLKQYYETDGKADSLQISFRPGSYVPVFRNLKNTRAEVSGFFPKPDLITDQPGVRLAVLPFLALSRDPNDDVFADGLTDELIYGLTRTDGLRVVGRGSVFPLKGAQSNAASVARDLGVRIVIHGTIRRHGNQLRVSIEATNSEGFQLWAERFDAVESDPFVLQEQMVAAVIARMAPGMSQVRDLKGSPGPATVEAYSLVVRGRQFMDLQENGGVLKAMQLFEDACAIAPGYYRAFSALAESCWTAVRLGLMDPALARPKARDAAERAVDLDPRSIEALASIGIIKSFLDLDCAGGELCFRKALELGIHARTAQLLSYNLMAQGRLDEASHFLTMGIDLDPFAPHNPGFREGLLYLQRRFEELLRQPFGSGPPKTNSVDHMQQVLLRVRAHVQVEGRQAAGEWLDQLRPQLALNPLAQMMLAEAHALAGRPEAARRQVGELNRTPRQVPGTVTATVHLALGETDRCLQELSAAIEERDPRLIWIGVDPIYDPIRTNPVFEQILADRQGDRLTGRSAAHRQ